MLHQFNMHSFVRTDQQGHQLRSGITTLVAETDLGPSPQLGFPQTITGKVVQSLTPEQLFQFKLKPDVQILFEGKAYKFSKLERDGTFELSIIQRP